MKTQVREFHAAPECTSNLRIEPSVIWCQIVETLFVLAMTNNVSASPATVASETDFM